MLLIDLAHCLWKVPGIFLKVKTLPRIRRARSVIFADYLNLDTEKYTRWARAAQCPFSKVVKMYYITPSQRIKYILYYMHYTFMYKRQKGLIFFLLSLMTKTLSYNAIIIINNYNLQMWVQENSTIYSVLYALNTFMCKRKKGLIFFLLSLMTKTLSYNAMIIIHKNHRMCMSEKRKTILHLCFMVCTYIVNKNNEFILKKQ